MMNSDFIQDYKNPIFISKKVYVEAQMLFAKERYQETRDLLVSAFEPTVRRIESSDIHGDELLALFADALFFLKEYESLYSFFPTWDILASYPQLQLVKIKLLDMDGHTKEAVSRCTSFIQENSNPISIHLPGFLCYRGYARSKVGEMKEAIEDLGISYSFFRFQKQDFQMGIAAGRQGALMLQMGDYPESTKWLRRSLEAFRTLDMPRKQSMVLLNLGIAQYKSGDLVASTKSLEESHAIGEEGNWPHRMVFTNIALANVLRMKREYSEARQRLHTAYSQAQGLGQPREEALALEFLGDVYRDEGQPEQARRFYARALAIGLTIAPKGDIVMEVHRRNGECLLAAGEFGEAVSELNQSIEMARAQKDRFEEGVALRVMAEVKKEVGDLKAAEDFICQSTEILDRIGARFELTLSLVSWAELKIRQVDRGNSDIPASLLLAQAWTHATKSLDHAIFTQVKPQIEECRNLVDRLSKLKAGQERTDARLAGAGGKDSRTESPLVIIHQSSVMRDLLELTDMFAGTGEPVLITGETGTGKELIARRLHRNGGQSTGKLVSVNVTTIPATMFEREMFGHVRGSFSGADRDGAGFVVEAQGGTLFLDEIGELPLDVQPKLLRLLQEGTYQALGDPSERQAQIRIVAATNASLEDMVRQGKFRADLYYRLKVLELNLPPLRERDGDVPLLLRHFLSETAGRNIDLNQYFDLDSLEMLERHDWPGNVRELEVLARRAQVEMCSRGKVRVAVTRKNGEAFFAKGPQEAAFDQEIPLELQASAGGNYSTTYNPANERARILLAMDQSGGNRAEAAEALGMARSTLYRRMKKLGL